MNARWMLALALCLGLWGCESSSPREVVDDPTIEVQETTITLTSDFPTNSGFRPQRRVIEARQDGISVSFSDETRTPKVMRRGLAPRVAWRDLWERLDDMDPFGREPQVMVQGRDQANAAGPYHLVEIVRGADSHSFSAQLTRNTFGVFTSNEVDAALGYVNTLVEFVELYATEPVSEPTADPVPETP